VGVGSGQGLGAFKGRFGGQPAQMNGNVRKNNQLVTQLTLLSLFSQRNCTVVPIDNATRHPVPCASHRTLAFVQLLVAAASTVIEPCEHGSYMYQTWISQIGSTRSRQRVWLRWSGCIYTVV
jgi:hypothetical protein